MVNGEYDYIAAFIDDFPSYNPTSIGDVQLPHLIPGG
jgi:hypothetical protein